MKIIKSIGELTNIPFLIVLLENLTTCIYFFDVLFSFNCNEDNSNEEENSFHNSYDLNTGLGIFM